MVTFCCTGVTYNIPLTIWLRPNHPYVPPMVYVTPTRDMGIQQSQFVDTNGVVYLPYLNEWKVVSDFLHVCVRVHVHVCIIICVKCRAIVLVPIGSLCDVSMLNVNSACTCDMLHVHVHTVQWLYMYVCMYVCIQT